MGPDTAAPPRNYSYGPAYRITLPLAIRGAVAVAIGRHRSLARDALTVLGRMPLPPLVRGADRIPEEGRVVVVANHYERPGLWMAWPAMQISHVVQARTGLETHWVAIQEWEDFSLYGIHIPRNLIRAVFERAFATYGIIAMPTPDAAAGARAAAMRSSNVVVKQGGILGVMPEGTVGPTPELLEAREGAGLFLLLLAASGARLLPAGVYEESGRLVTQFGDPFEFQVPTNLPRDARDAWARRRVMNAIKELIPESLWGAYRVQP